MPGMQLETGRYYTDRSHTELWGTMWYFFFPSSFKFHLATHSTNTYCGLGIWPLAEYWQYSLCHRGDNVQIPPLSTILLWFLFVSLFLFCSVLFAPQEIVSSSKAKVYILVTFVTSIVSSTMPSKTVGSRICWLSAEVHD